MTPQIGRPVQYKSSQGIVFPALIQSLDGGDVADLNVSERTGSDGDWKARSNVSRSVGLVANNSWDYVPD